MKEIKLTQGQVALVSDHRFEELNQYKWHALWCKGTKSFYAGRTVYLGKIDGKRKYKSFKMHRVILGLPAFPGDKRQGDHEDHDTLNNTDENIRRADKRQQAHNRRMRVDSKTGFKGVAKNGSGFTAYITLAGKKKSLGTRDTPEAAYHELWVPAALELHGEFARLA